MQNKTIENRRAAYDYALQDPITVGIVLEGAEVKALRMGKAHLKGAYVQIKDDELWLINATIRTDQDETMSTKPRKLLAHRKQIDALKADRQNGLTIVPLRITTNTRYVKVVVAAGRGKRVYDKRQVIKRREVERNIRTRR